MYWFTTFGDRVWQNEDNKLTASFVIPGAEKKDIKISVENGLLKLFYAGNDHIYQIDRVFRLPTGITFKDITSKYDAGVLTIVITKPKDFSQEIKVE